MERELKESDGGEELALWRFCVSGLFVRREEKERDSCGKKGSSYQKPQAALNSTSLSFCFSLPPPIAFSLSPSLCSLAMLMIDGLRVLMGTGEQELRSGLSWQLGEGAFCCCFT